MEIGWGVRTFFTPYTIARMNASLLREVLLYDEENGCFIIARITALLLRE
jgi:hypothetical protein